MLLGSCSSLGSVLSVPVAVGVLGGCRIEECIGGVALVDECNEESKDHESDGTACCDPVEEGGGTGSESGIGGTTEDTSQALRVLILNCDEEDQKQSNDNEKDK